MEYIHSLHLVHRFDHECRHFFRIINRVLGPIADAIPMWAYLGLLAVGVLYFIIVNENEQS